MLNSFQATTTAHNSSCLAFAIALGLAADSRAIEVLTVHELVSHCEYLESDPKGADAEYCIRYIQGFVDGAVVTDDRIMQDLDNAAKGGTTLTERAKRTRMPRRGAYDRPGSLAGFCLGDPLPLLEVVDTVVADLVALAVGDATESPVRVAVDDSLRRHYPCAE